MNRALTTNEMLLTDTVNGKSVTKFRTPGVLAGKKKIIRPDYVYKKLTTTKLAERSSVARR
jgi:hypothetical protein